MAAVERRPTTNLADVPVRRLLGELERRAQDETNKWSTDDVLYLIVLAAVIAVLTNVDVEETPHGHATLH